MAWLLEHDGELLRRTHSELPAVLGWPLDNASLEFTFTRPLTDRGAEALLAIPDLTRLEKLDIHHYCVSPEMVERLQALGIEVDTSDPREAEDFGAVDSDRRKAALLLDRSGAEPIGFLSGCLPGSNRPLRYVFR
jgi:hypothetical protein